MFARTAKRMGIPIPVLLGRRMTPLEVQAAIEVGQEWSLIESLAVVIAERVDWLRWTMQSVNAKRGTNIEPPFHMPRPEYMQRRAAEQKVSFGQFAKSMQKDDM